jgi:hypothetical protein
MKGGVYLENWKSINLIKLIKHGKLRKLSAGKGPTASTLSDLANHEFQFFSFPVFQCVGVFACFQTASLSHRRAAIAVLMA